MEITVEKIEQIARQGLELEDLKDCFLVEVVHSNTKVQVFIDSDEGIGFEQCRKLSRFMESVLDEKLILGEKYILEVSSPGISRPLKFLRQYPKNIGREIECSMKDDTKIKGLLIDVKDETLIIETKDSDSGELINKEISFDAVRSSKILISFGKKKMKK